MEFDDGGVIGISGAKLVSRSYIDSENCGFFAKFSNEIFVFFMKLDISDQFLFESSILK